MPRPHSVTLGVQGLITDQENHVLLIRHGYRPGWFFPGGGVERGECLEQALAREIVEETGVVITGNVRLFGLYSHFDAFPGDHIALFIIEAWQREHIPPPNSEIAEQAFFPLDRLPQLISQGTARRLREVFAAKERSPVW